MECASIWACTTLRITVCNKTIVIVAFLDVADLEAKENRLDEMIRQCTNQLRILTEDPENSRQAYVNYHDIRSIKSFEEQTVIAIKAPPETRLEVPDPNQVMLEVRAHSHLAFCVCVCDFIQVLLLSMVPFWPRR